EGGPRGQGVGHGEPGVVTGPVVGGGDSGGDVGPRRGRGRGGLLDLDVGRGLDVGPLGGRVVGVIGVGGGGSHRGRVGQVGRAGGVHVHHEVQGGVRRPRGQGPQVPRHRASRERPAVVGRDEGGAGRDGVRDLHALGVGGPGGVHGQGVGEVGPRGHRVRRVGLGDGQVRLRVHGGVGGGGVVGGVGVGGGGGHRRGVGDGVAVGGGGVHRGRDDHGGRVPRGDGAQGGRAGPRGRRGASHTGAVLGPVQVGVQHV